MQYVSIGLDVFLEILVIFLIWKNNFKHLYKMADKFGCTILWFIVSFLFILGTIYGVYTMIIT